MSDKDREYEIKYDSINDTYVVREVKEFEGFNFTDSTKPTIREKIHDGLVKTGRVGRILLTLCLNWYGSLFRYSSNSIISVLLGFVDIVCGKIIVPILIIWFDSSNILYFLILPLILWVIDLISIFTKNKIIFLGDKTYKNYLD